jgi:tRNA(His) 5'-end guanylyltransferase
MKIVERIIGYINSYEYKITPRLPVIYIINGRSFNKATSLLDKPFDISFAETLAATMLKICSEIDGAVFGYCFNDEIVIVSRNDLSLDMVPWYDNKIQKLCSVSSSIVTSYFNKLVLSNDLNIIGDLVFSSQVFAAPSINEAINILVGKQQQATQTSVHFACVYELLKKYDKLKIKELLYGLAPSEKADLLEAEVNKDFSSYPSIFRRGIACYRQSQIINNEERFKWTLDTNLPVFTQDANFLINLLK